MSLLRRSLALLAMLLATAGEGDAQTWRWRYTTHVANSPPITAQSTVVLSGNDLTMSYASPAGDPQAPIASCRIKVSDIETAVATRRGNVVSLVVALKPGRVADCGSAKQPSAALLADDERIVQRVAAALNQARPIVAAPPPRPRPSVRLAQASPLPSPSPKPTSSPSTVVRLEDWVQNEGLFLFVRVRNTGHRMVYITNGEVRDCKNVDVGCGAIARRYAVEPFGTVTIAAVATNDKQQKPSFTYRYTAEDGSRTVAESGSSAKAPPDGSPLMSSEELRTAEASALAALRAPASSPAQPSQGADSPPRLVRRGSSRLAIGQTGTALVRVIVGADGTPQEATVVRTTNRRLTAAAIETAVSSTYAPAIRNGRPVEEKYIATFSFNGEDPATSSIPIWRRSPSPEPSE